MNIPADLSLMIEVAEDAARRSEQDYLKQAAQQALGLLDLTSLNSDDTADTITQLCEKAVTPYGNVAAVCVYPQFALQARAMLEDQGVRVASVVNFPEGRCDTGEVAVQTRTAIADGAQEIDVVMDWQALLAGQRDKAFETLNTCRKACGNQVIMKVIIETGGLGSAALIREASQIAIDAGADFLKTSTGKLEPAATLEAAAIMLNVIKENNCQHRVGFKAAGGIKDTRTAAAYLSLAEQIMGADWVSSQKFRFGASGVLSSLLSVLKDKEDLASAAGY